MAAGTMMVGMGSVILLASALVPVGVATMMTFVRSFLQVLLFQTGFVGCVVGMGIVIFHGCQ